ncbi:serine hydrolase [Algoriphagus sp. A40]|uniref:serine hydrolase domain-containing protein n=1 Tax=Algoriphagus sp. A40 TaxID=1945863 RepID=UPI0009852685|nr:serine hydrolase domain-containing protein [Algoriphagus sp. A40]OOG73047.1 hypothetical protein B0E43_14070 [Algoriphagus sp. A40]
MRSILLLLLFIPFACFAQTDLPVSIDRYMDAQVRIKQFSGTVLVANEKEIIYKKGFGEADREWGNLNTPETKFRIGSNTKQFTAAAILKLAEEGKLSLDDKLSKYIPDYPKGDTVTVHMLLSHTSGITNYTNLDEFWDGPAFIRLETDSLISLFKHRPFDFEPGAKCSYSNSGYILLGLIIEKASGQSYSSYLAQNIITPAGLQNTALDKIDSVLTFRARGYYRRKDVFRNAGYISMEGSWSAGALYSTVDDLYEWTKSLHHNEIVSLASLKKMTTPYGSDGKDPFGYGLIIDSLENHLRVWHDGSIPGFSSYVAYYPTDGMYIIALSNNSSNTPTIGVGLGHLIFGLPIELPYVHKEVTLSEEQLEVFLGKFEGSVPFEITKKEGKLFRIVADGYEIELKAESPQKLFFDDDSDRQLEFQFDGSGAVASVFLISSGVRTEIEKIE